MPVKDLLALAAAMLFGIMATHPTHPLLAVRRVQFAILHDFARTNNWGDPSLPFRCHRPPRKAEHFRSN